jgi:hypothetical protein
MPTVTISAEETPGTKPSLHVSLLANAYVAGDNAQHRRAPLFVPLDQAYYWTIDWQRAEAEAMREIADGQSLRFASGAAAAEWLLSDDA